MRQSLNILELHLQIKPARTKRVKQSKFGEACHHSVQSVLSSRLLSRNVKVKVYKTITLPVVLFWSVTLG
jgi:hypothetical protein